MRPIKIELYRGQAENARDDLGVYVGYRDTRWRWTARRGGRTIAASTEAYSERIKAVDNIALIFGIPGLRQAAYRRPSIDYLAVRPGSSMLIEVKTR